MNILKNIAAKFLASYEINENKVTFSFNYEIADRTCETICSEAKELEEKVMSLGFEGAVCADAFGDMSNTHLTFELKSDYRILRDEEGHVVATKADFQKTNFLSTYNSEGRIRSEELEDENDMWVLAYTYHDGSSFMSVIIENEINDSVFNDYEELDQEEALPYRIAIASRVYETKKQGFEVFNSPVGKFRRSNWQGDWEDFFFDQDHAEQTLIFRESDSRTEWVKDICEHIDNPETLLEYLEGTGASFRFFDGELYASEEAVRRADEQAAYDFQ